MKKIFLVPALALCLVACTKSSGDQKAELETLKKQEHELKAKITLLEAAMGAGKDSTLSGTMVSVLKLKLEIFKNYIDI